MPTEFGSGVSTTLPVGQSNFLGALHLKLKPSVDSEHNFNTELAEFNASKRLKALAFSGVLNKRSAGLDSVFITTLDPTFTGLHGLNPNEMAFQNSDYLVNGWVINLVNSQVNGGVFSDPDYCALELPAPPSPAPMFRTDLVYLEVFRRLISVNPSTDGKPSATEVYRYGNIQYAGANIADDLLNPDLLAESSKRLQLQYAIRVAQGVNFDTYSDGLDDPVVYAQGGNASPTNTWQFTRSAEDPGLFIAGDGSGSARSDLANVDGLVYAIPLFKVHRRNSAAYALNNPNGSATGITSAVSDRPDGLFYDEIAPRDIVDLRHEVVLQSSYSEILEDSFTKLITRNLKTEFGKDDTIGNQIRGLEMLTVDGYSLIDQTGVYDLNFDPDGLRRDYSEESRVHDVIYTLDTSSNVSGSPVSYNTGTRLLNINIVDGLLQAEPEIYTDGTLRVDAMDPGGWTGSYPGSSASGTLNIAYAGQTIYIKMSIAYSSAGHRFVSTDYFKVYNDSTLVPENWAFTVDPSTFTAIRNTQTPGLPVVSGEVDEIFHHPIITIDGVGAISYPDPAPLSNLSYQTLTETYEYHMVGNGTATYNLPATANGRTILGVHAVYETDDSPIAYAQIDPTSVTRNIGGTYTVVLGSVFGASKILKFVLVLEATATVLNTATKGLREIMVLETHLTTGDGGTTYSVESTGIPYSFGSYLDTSSDYHFLAYVAGTRVDIDEDKVTKSFNKVEFEFNSVVAIGDEIRVYLLVSYAPQTTDRLQISYDRIPYQGLGLSSVLEGALILAKGQAPLIHSLGTQADTPRRNQESFALSEVLPLALGFLDSNLTNEDLSLSNSQFTSFKMLRLPLLNHDYRTGSTGKLPSPGDVIFLEDNLVEPVRGISDKIINLRNRLDLSDYPMEFITPALDSSAAHQVVDYYLIQESETKEIFMLVLTIIDSSTGDALFKSSTSETGVSYDVYRLEGRPLLKR